MMYSRSLMYSRFNMLTTFWQVWSILSKSKTIFVFLFFVKAISNKPIAAPNASTSVPAWGMMKTLSYVSKKSSIALEFTLAVTLLRFSTVLFFPPYIFSGWFLKFTTTWSPPLSIANLRASSAASPSSFILASKDAIPSDIVTLTSLFFEISDMVFKIENPSSIILSSCFRFINNIDFSGLIFTNKILFSLHQPSIAPKNKPWTADLNWKSKLAVDSPKLSKLNIPTTSVYSRNFLFASSLSVTSKKYSVLFLG